MIAPNSLYEDVKTLLGIQFSVILRAPFLRGDLNPLLGVQSAYSKRIRQSGDILFEERLFTNILILSSDRGKG